MRSVKRCNQAVQCFYHSFSTSVGAWSFLLNASHTCSFCQSIAMMRSQTFPRILGILRVGEVCGVHNLKQNRIAIWDDGRKLEHSRQHKVESSLPWTSFAQILVGMLLLVCRSILHRIGWEFVIPSLLGMGWTEIFPICWEQRLIPTLGWDYLEQIPRFEDVSDTNSSQYFHPQKAMLAKAKSILSYLR